MRVNCSGRGIVELDLNVVFASEEERNALAVVKHLDLSRNELKLVSNLQPFSCLATLDLSHNHVQQLAGLPLGLVRLCVAHNELTTLDGLVTLPFLQELDVSHNRLSSLAGLPRTSPLTCLKLGHNRLSNIHGVEVVHSTLQVLELDSNYLCVVEDLRPLTRMKALQQLTVRDNPMVDNSNYRNLIMQLVPSLLVLDGTAVAGGQSPPRPLSAQMPPTALPQTASTPNLSAAETSSVNTSISGRPATSRPMSYEGIRQRNEVRRGDVMEDNRKLLSDMEDLQRLLDRERLENDKAQRRIKALEGEVREVRRVLAEELNKLTQVRQENDQLRADAETYKSRADKIARDYKYSREKIKSERQRRLEDLERSKVSHQAVVHTLRSRLQEYADDGRTTTDAERALREEVSRLHEHVAALERENADLTLSLSTHSNAHYSVEEQRSQYVPPPSHHHHNRNHHQTPPAAAPRAGPIFPQQHPRPVPRAPSPEDSYDPYDGSSMTAAPQETHMVDFASQLKDWLVSELQERRLDGSLPPTSAPAPRGMSPRRQDPIMAAPRQGTGLQSPARSSNSGLLDEVWARNDTILGSAKMKRT